MLSYEILSYGSSVTLSDRLFGDYAEETHGWLLANCPGKFLRERYPQNRCWVIAFKEPEDLKKFEKEFEKCLTKKHSANAQSTKPLHS